VSSGHILTDTVGRTSQHSGQETEQQLVRTRFSIPRAVDGGRSMQNPRDRDWGTKWERALQDEEGHRATSQVSMREREELDKEISEFIF